MAIVEVWPQWVRQVYYNTQTAATTASITSNSCWSIWASQDSGTTSDSVWTIWAGNSYDQPTDTSTYVSSDYVWQYWNRVPSTLKPTVIPAKILTPEEIAASEAKLKAELERQERERQERLRRERESSERAMQLLKEFLSEQQRTELEKHKHVKVIGSKGKTKYLIEISGRVYELADETTKVASYCIHSRDMCYPDGDEMLAKILLLQADEDKFLKTANKTVLQPAVR